MTTNDLLPLFVNLAGRRVVLVGGGPVAASKLAALRAAGADVRVVAPDVHADIERAGVPIDRRAFIPADLDEAWLVVAAATPAVNREVAEAAEARRVFVNAVDDPANASAFLSGVVRRDGVTLAISTAGGAPGLTALLRQALDAVLPQDLRAWVGEARRLRAGWRRDGVPMAERRPLLLEALNRLYGRSEDLRCATGRSQDLPHDDHADVAQDFGPISNRADVGQDFSPASSHAGVGQDFSPASPGHVSLVGAGPGDPALLTRKAVLRLRSADLVLYDALVDERVLHLARRAQRFFVGKRAGRHALTQAEIHAVMIRAARRGRRIVRLKGGDPFVFGRGGEEALALKQANVPFEIVPGITSAVAAAALAGIPVTHRGLASAFLVVSGHDEEAFAASIGALEPEGVTIVVLMGVGRRAALATQLLDRGWPGGTPAAMIAAASRSDQRVWRGTLGELAAGSAGVTDDAPATIVVGEVAALDCADAREQAPRLPSEHVAELDDAQVNERRAPRG